MITSNIIIHEKDNSPMAYIHEGEFLMGTSPDQFNDLVKSGYKREWFHDELPQHIVNLDSFFIDIYPVSNFQYSLFLRDTQYKEPKYWKNAKLNHPLKPVVGILWEDAIEYCKWSNKRLPTEAEWEKASRGIDGRLYPWGNQFSQDLVNSGSNYDGSSFRGEFIRGKSPYGVEDMSGNIWEWVNDFYSEDYYKYSEYKNPKGPKNGAYMVVRGGSWICEASYLRCAGRDIWREPRAELKFFGFRTAMDYDSSKEIIEVPNKISIEPEKRRDNIIIGDYFLASEKKYTKITGIKPEKIDLDILFEDNEIIVLNKRAGMLVHPTERTPSGTLVSALLNYTNNNLSTLGDFDKPGIVHRLDRYTSGTMIVAKTNVAYESLSAQFREHTTNKYYHAIVYGKLPHDQTFVLPIGNDNSIFDKKAVKFFYGKDAITHMTILEKFKNFSLIQLKIETGRTHQIRVHLSHVGYPLVGDTKYYTTSNAIKKFELTQNQKSAILSLGQRQMLHAKRLGFVHPTTREYMEFETPYANDFQNILNIIK